MKITFRIPLTGIAAIMTLGTSLLPAASQSGGNFTVNVSGNETGDLTVQGEAHIGGSLDFGTTAASQSAMLFNYTENGTAYTLDLAATRPSTAFLWQDNGSGTLRPKMQLDGNNVLSLFGSNGTAGIVLNPNTGGITLAGTGSGIMLSDGTVLSDAASLHSTALYDSGGVPRMTFDTNGQLTVKGSGTTGVFAQFSDSLNSPKITISNDGGVAIGTVTPSTNSRLTLKGRNASGWPIFDTYDSNGNQTFLIADSGSILQKRGVFIQSNPYNTRTFTLNSGEGYLDASDVLLLNRYTLANIYLNYGGGRTGVGTNNVSSARMQIVNDPTNGVASDAVLRLVKRADQTGNIFEVQDSAAANLLRINSAGNLGIGTAATGQPGALFSYTENGTNYAFNINATRPSATFLWQDNAAGTAKPKMQLDGNNVLSLFGANGTAGIVLNPNTGGIGLSGNSSGITLSDGTVLSNGASLHSTALYDSGGNARMTFDGSGNLVVSAPVKLEGTGAGIDFGSGNVLDQNNVTYLKQTLANLGYREPGSPVDHSFSFPSNFTVNKAVTDMAGNIYVAGTFAGSGMLGTMTFTSAGYRDVFVAKVNGSGAVQWAKSFGGTNQDTVAGFAVDAGGNAYVTGSFCYSMNSGLLQSAGNGDVYVVKLNGYGTVQWAKSFGGTGNDAATGIAMDGSGNVYVAGYFSDSMSSGLPQTLTSAGSADIFVAKLNGSGMVQWAESFGGSSWDSASSLAMDAGGNAYVTGCFGGSMDSGLPQTLTSAGGRDVYVAKLNGSGVVQWAKSFGGAGNDAAADLAVDASGNAYVTGCFGGSMDSGLPQTLTSAGNSDIFVAKLNGSGTVQWAKSFGGENSYSYLSGLAVDTSGNAYVTGYFYGPMDSGLPQTISTDSTIWNNSEPYWEGGFVVKVTENGTVPWAEGFGGTNEDFSFTGIALGGGGTLILMGGGSNTGIGNQVVRNSFVYLGTEASLVSSGAGATTGFSWGSSRASSDGAVALGMNALAYSTGAVALGGGTSLGDHCFSAGLQTQADGYASTALGYLTSVSGYVSTAFGEGASASNYVSTAFGEYTSASGFISTAFGEGASASGYVSTAFGEAASASGYVSTAFGEYTSACGSVSTAVGEQTKANAYASFALGRNNVGLVDTNANGDINWNEQDPILEIGNGEDWGTASNALTLFKNANLRTGGTAEFKGGVRVPPQGDLSMGDFTAGQNPADLDPTLGLKYQGE